MPRARVRKARLATARSSSCHRRNRAHPRNRSRSRRRLTAIGPSAAQQRRPGQTKRIESRFETLTRSTGCLASGRRNARLAGFSGSHGGCMPARAHRVRCTTACFSGIKLGWLVRRTNAYTTPIQKSGFGKLFRPSRLVGFYISPFLSGPESENAACHSLAQENYVGKETVLWQSELRRQ